MNVSRALRAQNIINGGMSLSVQTLRRLRLRQAQGRTLSGSRVEFSEGIAFAFRYGLDIMRENDIRPSVIRAGKANMFLSDLFTDAFVNATNVPVELFESDGSVGVALGAGIGAGIFKSRAEAFGNQKRIGFIEPTQSAEYNEVYEAWHERLGIHMAESGSFAK